MLDIQQVRENLYNRNIAERTAQLNAEICGENRFTKRRRTLWLRLIFLKSRAGIK